MHYCRLSNVDKNTMGMYLKLDIIGILYSNYVGICYISLFVNKLHLNIYYIYIYKLIEI